MFDSDTYKRGDAIAISWHIDDVKSIDGTLSDDDARAILKAFAYNHSGSMSAMWDDLRYHVNEFKGKKCGLITTDKRSD